MLNELNITLYNQNAEPVELSKYLESNVFLLFVYPNNKNTVFIEILKELGKLKINKIAISSDAIDVNLNVWGINKLEIDILSDPSKIVAKRLGILNYDLEREIFIPTIFLFLDGNLEKKKAIYDIKDYINFLNSIKAYL